MKIDRKDIDAFLKQEIVAGLRKKGFKGSYPHLRRTASRTIELISFQFDKYGGGFCIEAGKVKNQPFKSYWGEIIEPSKLSTYYLPIDKRMRLLPSGISGGSSTNLDWFRYDKGTLLRNPIKRLKKELHESLPLLEEALTQLNV